MFFKFPQTTKRGDCCNYCFNDPGCYGYHEGVVGSTGYFCEIGFINPGRQPFGPNVSSKCPTGTYYWPLAGTGGVGSNAYEGAGLGPCGTTS